MSVRIQPNHTTIGVPQWRHVPAHRALGQHVPDMGTLTLSADGEYDLTLPDSVWLTVMEDLQEHFARKAAKPLVSDATIAGVAAHSADYNARGGNDGIIPETPQVGDAVMGWWPEGCGVASHADGGPYCIRHVNYNHVATAWRSVRAVWAMTADEQAADFQRAMGAQR